MTEIDSNKGFGIGDVPSSMSGDVKFEAPHLLERAYESSFEVSVNRVFARNGPLSLAASQLIHIAIQKIPPRLGL